MTQPPTYKWGASPPPTHTNGVPAHPLYTHKWGASLPPNTASTSKVYCINLFVAKEILPQRFVSSAASGFKKPVKSTVA